MDWNVHQKGVSPPAMVSWGAEVATKSSATGETASKL
jgi:hypothetical protein